jgi:hypothetical protein
MTKSELDEKRDYTEEAKFHFEIVGFTALWSLFLEVSPRAGKY